MGNSNRLDVRKLTTKLTWRIQKENSLSEMRSRIVYFIVLLCLVYNLQLLYEESYALSYRSTVKNLIDDPFSFSVCLPLADLAKQTERGKKIYDFPSSGVVNSTSFIDRVFEQIKLAFETNFKAENFSHFMQKDRSYLFRRHFCFLVSDHHLNMGFAFKTLRYKILLVSKISKSFFFNTVHSNEDEFSYLTHIKIFKLIIKNFNNPFSTCVKRRVAGQPPYSKFNCLNDCLKRNDSKFPYYYEAGERIDLNDSRRDREAEESCYAECKRESCSLEYVLAVNAIETYEKPQQLPITEGKLGMPNPLITAEYYNLDIWPTIKLSEFYLQFIGLISLFFDINVIENLPGLVRFLSLAGLARSSQCKRSLWRRRWNEKFDRIYPKFKFLLLICSVYALVEISFYMWRSYLQDLERPINLQLSIYSTEIQSFSVYMCYAVRELLYGKSLRELRDSAIDEQIMSNYTFEEIENLTNGMPEIKTFLKYGSRKKEIKLKVSPKVLFRQSIFLDMQMFARCFLINVHNLQEERYKSLLANTKLIVETKTEFVTVYLAHLNSGLESAYLYKGRFQVNKMRSSRLDTSKLFNCSNYHFSHRLKGCNSRSTCLNRCKVYGYLRKHSRFLVHNQTVVEKGQFGGYLRKHTRFTGENDANLTAACDEEFAYSDCENEFYLESYKIHDMFYAPANRTVIELFLEILVDRDVKPSKEKTAFAILNIESILIGGNVTKLLLTVLAFIRITFKTKWYSWFKPLVFLLCFLGFLVHMYVIFRSLIVGELLETSCFKKNDTVRFPDLIFCFEFDLNEIDRNYRLTGDYLDRWTNLTFAKVFEKISYLDQNGMRVNVSNFTDQLLSTDLSYSTFFLMNMKCFQIAVNLVYEEKLFLFAEDPFALKFWLLPQMTTQMVYFTCKHPGSKQLNMFNEFRFGCGQNYKRTRFQIKLELLRAVYSEAFLFEALKNPWTILLGSRTEIADATLYYDGMSSEFKRLFNSTSKVIMLDRDFELELDDHLFLQYFYQRQNV